MPIWGAIITAFEEDYPTYEILMIGKPMAVISGYHSSRVGIIYVILYPFASLSIFRRNSLKILTKEILIRLRVVAAYHRYDS